MNKKAETTELNDAPQDNLSYFILALIFFSIVFYFVINTSNSAIIWDDYYAKEWVKTINSANPNDIITLDIHKATQIAKKNGITNFNEITTFDNTNNRVCIKLSQNRKACYSYFNNVDVIDPEIKLGMPVNTLTVKIIEKVKNEKN